MSAVSLLYSASLVASVIVVFVGVGVVVAGIRGRMPLSLAAPLCMVTLATLAVITIPLWAP